MKCIVLLLFCSPLLFVTGCEYFYGLDLENRSAYSIYFYSEFKSKSYDSDSLIRFSFDDLEEVKSQEEGVVWIGINVKMHERMDAIGARQVRIYIFHPDTLAKYSWEEIKAGHKVLQRYDLTRRDLQQLDEEYPEVPFPPDATIRNARMFPPYGTYSKGK